MTPKATSSDDTTPVRKKPGPKPKSALVEKAAPVRGVATTAHATPMSSAQAAMIAKVKQMVQKTTNQMPVAPSYSQLPHVSTGSFPIDDLIGGTLAQDGSGPVCPGFPRRRVTEVYGPESSGKTTLVLSAIADLQRKGGTAMFIDFEHALHHGYAKAIGVDFDDGSLLHYQPDTLEEGFKMLYIGVGMGIDFIAVDSVAAMVPAAELAKKVDDAAKVGALAKPLSENLPKIVGWLAKHPLGNDKRPLKDHPGTACVFINQTRMLIGGMGYGDNETTPGGKALKFYAYLRLRTSRNRTEKIKKKNHITGKEANVPFGNLMDVKVVKSKVDAKQNHTTQVFVRYGYGIDNYLSMIEAGVTNKLVRKEGSRLTFQGEQYHGRDKFRRHLIENPQTFEALRQQVLQAVNASAVVVEEDEDMSNEDDILQTLDDGMSGASSGDDGGSSSDAGESEEEEVEVETLLSEDE